MEMEPKTKLAGDEHNQDGVSKVTDSADKNLQDIGQVRKSEEQLLERISFMVFFSNLFRSPLFHPEV